MPAPVLGPAVPGQPHRPLPQPRRGGGRGGRPQHPALAPGRHQVNYKGVQQAVKSSN